MEELYGEFITAPTGDSGSHDPAEPRRPGDTMAVLTTSLPAIRCEFAELRVATFLIHSCTRSHWC